MRPVQFYPMVRNIRADAAGGIYAAPTNHPLCCCNRKTAGGAMPRPCRAKFIKKLKFPLCHSKAGIFVFYGLFFGFCFRCRGQVVALTVNAAARQQNVYQLLH